jgi:hypothetical protein
MPTPSLTPYHRTEGGVSYDGFIVAWADNKNGIHVLPVKIQGTQLIPNDVSSMFTWSPVDYSGHHFSDSACAFPTLITSRFQRFWLSAQCDYQIWLIGFDYTVNFDTSISLIPGVGTEWVTKSANACWYQHPEIDVSDIDTLHGETPAITFDAHTGLYEAPGTETHRDIEVAARVDTDAFIYTLFRGGTSTDRPPGNGGSIGLLFGHSTVRVFDFGMAGLLHLNQPMQVAWHTDKGIVRNAYSFDAFPLRRKVPIWEMGTVEETGMTPTMEIGGYQWDDLANNQHAVFRGIANGAYSRVPVDALYYSTRPDHNTVSVQSWVGAPFTSFGVGCLVKISSTISQLAGPTDTIHVLPHVQKHDSLALPHDVIAVSDTFRTGTEQYAFYRTIGMEDSSEARSWLGRDTVTFRQVLMDASNNQPITVFDSIRIDSSSPTWRLDTLTRSFLPNDTGRLVYIAQRVQHSARAIDSLGHGSVIDVAPAPPEDSAFGKADERYRGRAGLVPDPDIYPIHLHIYPNPVRVDAASIEFTVPDDDAGQLVDVYVYDIMGRYVARLVGTPQTAGVHTLDWSAPGIATGRYIVAVRTATHSQSKQVIFER